MVLSCEGDILWSEWLHDFNSITALQDRNDILKPTVSKSVLKVKSIFVFLNDLLALG